ncbi:autophagy-related protein 22 [Zymoseptoria brevis]|uniref:Autophagy-related protein n=1 Tax=Zymoseptoria brevis TaxID=1047168 RepID=A0A0F4GJU9_9PEZI|nr:autophagy-related protein 22 [Zymoseptoria brevis]
MPTPADPDAYDIYEHASDDDDDDDDDGLNSNLDDDEPESGRGEARTPRFPGEDLTPTTERELKGWYFAGLAAEVYAVCGVGSFAPVTLEQLAREAGVLRSDGVTPCIVPKGSTPSARHIVRSLFTRADESNQCVVYPFGHMVSSSSFALYTFSAAVFVQALVLISFSPVADYGTYRKRLLLTFAFTGASATIAMLLIFPSIYYIGSLLTIIAVVCLGSVFVLLNSFLPLLASNHPTVTAKSRSLPSHPATSTSPALTLSTSISSRGVGLGYIAAVSVQILCILLLITLKRAAFTSESTPLRILLLLVGICWATMTLPAVLYLRNRPGPVLSIPHSRLPPFLQYLTFAWSSVYTTLLTALRLRQTILFLIAWFLLSDAIATVSGTAILFARTELHLSTIQVALLSITATVSGIAGAFAWPRISRSYALETKSTILACILLMEIIPLYGLLGFLAPIRSLGFLGLQQPWEIYPLGVVHGFVMGGLSSYCRAFYGEIIPPGSEAAFYALYAITDKGSSAVGPAIVGVIVDRVGSIRPAFGFLAVLILMPLPILWRIDVKRGKEEAVALSKLSGMRGGEERSVRLDEMGGSGAAEGLLGGRREGE